MKNLTTKTVESLAAFFTGDILATIVAFNLLSDMAKPLLLAIITGLFGGAAALLGKDIYKWLKNKLTKGPKNGSE